MLASEFGSKTEEKYQLNSSAFFSGGLSGDPFVSDHTLTGPMMKYCLTITPKQFRVIIKWIFNLGQILSVFYFYRIFDILTEVSQFTAVLFSRYFLRAAYFFRIMCLNSPSIQGGEFVSFIVLKCIVFTGDIIFAKWADFALAKHKQPEMSVKFNDTKTNQL